MGSVTCLVDQRLDFRQYARNNSFGPRRIWPEVADLLKRRIVYKRVIKFRVEQHIVLAGKTKSITGIHRIGLLNLPDLADATLVWPRRCCRTLKRRD
jgi:hypothetical protein